MKKFLILVAGLAAGVALWHYFSSANEDSSNNPRERQSAPVKVITQSVLTTENNRIFEAVGTGRARLSVQIYPAVTDEVTEILFNAQDRVEKGQILIRLEDEEERLAVDLAQVQIEDARGLLGRYENAVLEGAVPESEVDSARADFKAAEVALKQARLAVAERQIRAPFDGIVGIPNVDIGERIGPDTMITSLDNRSLIYVDFEIPEALAGVINISSGDALNIVATTPAYPNQEFTGVIAAQESRIDPERRTMTVRAHIDNEQDLLRPGMSFDIVWTIPGQSYPTVPEIAVQWEREGSYVWLVKDGIAVKAPATIVARRDGNVLVEGAVQMNDTVVIEGVQRLRPDQAVEALE